MWGRLETCGRLSIGLPGDDTRGPPFGCWLSPLRSFRLRQTVPVAGVVLHDRLHAVEPVGGRRSELDAFRVELLVRLAAVAGLQNAPIEPALLQQSPDRGRGLGLYVGAVHLHQDDLQIGLALGTDREPAKTVIHLGVHANLEAEYVRVEVLGRVLIENVDRGV